MEEHTADNATTQFFSISTNISGYTVTWTFFPSFELFVFICVVILNGSVLFLFIFKSCLHLPFNIYLGSLLLANLYFAILDNPIDIINFISSSWWLGNTACTVYLYAIYVSQGIMFNSHLLITANRIWAVTFPYSYRSHNNMRMSLGLCIGVWLYVHGICLPAFILDTLYFRLPVATKGCELNTAAVTDLNLTMQFLIYVLPNAVIVLAYPYLWYKRHRGRRFRAAIAPAMSASNGVKSAAVSGRTAELELYPVQGDLGPVQSAVVKEGKNKRVFSAVNKDSKYAFTVLTLLTTSATICWTPVNTYFVIACFMDTSGMTTVYQATEALFMLQPALDPIYFAIALPDLRDTVTRMFRLSKRTERLQTVQAN